MPVAITREQRDLLYELVMTRLTGIGDVWIAVETLAGRVRGLRDRVRDLERELESVQVAAALGARGADVEQIVDVDGMPVLVRRVDDLDADGRRELAERLLDRVPAGIVVVAQVSDGRALLLVRAASQAQRRTGADAVVRALAEAIGGRGGGRPHLAEGGGGDPARLDDALGRLPAIVGAPAGPREGA